MNLGVMLASSGTWSLEALQRLEGTHYFDIKHDGVRALALIDQGTVQLINRNNVDITHRYPDLVQEFIKKFGRVSKMVLDGEIGVANEDDGFRRIDFKATARRDRCSDPAKIHARAKETPADFVAFDLLMHGDLDLRRTACAERLSRLESLFLESPGVSSHIHSSPLYDNAALAYDVVREHKLEGIIAKSKTAPYRHGRQSAWIKFKPTETESFVVLGLDASAAAGRSETFGALFIGQEVPGGYKQVGRVGSGFTQADLEWITAEWRKLEAGLRTEPIWIEVEYQEVTKDGALRFPVFKGVRSDIVA